MIASREIYWNIPKILVGIHYALFAVAVVVFMIGIFWRIRLWRLGDKENRLDNLITRFWRLVIFAGFQYRILKRIYQAIMHSGIFYGLAVLYIGTLLVLVQADLGIIFLKGPFYQGFSLVMDLAGVGLVAGLMMALFRRYVLRPPELWAANMAQKFDDLFIILLLLVIAATGFVLQGFRMEMTEIPGQVWFRYWSPIGLVSGELFDFIGLHKDALTWHPILWFVHSTLVLVFIAYFPYSKIFHVFTAPANIFLSKLTPKGQFKHIDLENTEKFGVAKINDFSWKHLLDLDACTRCGRCDTGCPTNLSQKPLKPKKLVLDLKNELNRQVKLTGSKVVKEPEPLLDKTVTSDEIWACTTCHYCQSNCPVFIEHTDKVVELRRNLVLAESNFPAELKSMFKNIEVNGNPWPVGWEKRSDWCKGLDVKILNAGEKCDVLLWVGCAGATDDRNTKVATALVKLLKAAGVDFAILGNAEKCCGDPARQSGNEYLYQMRAMENIETLKGRKFNRILTYCPHCYHTIKNEYPQLDKSFGDINIIHHSQLLLDLVNNDQLKLKAGVADEVVYHDSCYLGRYNDIYCQPREVLLSAGVKLREMSRRKEGSFCCGAGGGRMWMEEKLGKRINQIRAKEAMDSISQGIIATACPYCLTMIGDGVKELSVESSSGNVRVLDIAEVLVSKI
ncbi:MAG: (Fe-S)-binding protein [Candidatus Brocadiia bacterium]